MRKDSCENARVLLPLTNSHDVQSGPANAHCKLDNHALCLNANQVW